MSAEQLLTWIESSEANGGKRRLLILDPRSPEAFDNRRLPGARSVRLVDVSLDQGRNPAWRRVDTFVVYGDHPSDPAASALAKRLIRKGYDDVYLFDGGLLVWDERGLPLAGAGVETP